MVHAYVIPTFHIQLRMDVINFVKTDLFILQLYRAAHCVQG